MKNILLVDFMYIWNATWFANNGKSSKMYHYMKAITKSMLRPESGYDKVYFVLDGAHGTQSRKEIYPEYKANRNDKNRTDIYKRVDEFICETTDIYSDNDKFVFLRSDEYEADDIIATLCNLRKARYHIFSGDKDLMQLIVLPEVYVCKVNHMFIDYNSGMTLYPVYTEKEILQKYSRALKCNIDNVTDLIKFKTFRGDMSDNIPSAVRGMRATTIKSLIDNCWAGNEDMSESVIESMLDFTDGKLHDKLVENKESIIRNWKLMQLAKVDVDKVLGATNKLVIKTCQ